MHQSGPKHEYCMNLSIDYRLPSAPHRNYVVHRCHKCRAFFGWQFTSFVQPWYQGILRPIEVRNKCNNCRLIYWSSLSSISVKKRRSMYIILGGLRGQELELSRVSFNACYQSYIHSRDIGQWTSQARDLYDLLILTFTDVRGAMADLTALQNSSKLSSTDWDDLLQYTIQVCLKEP